MHMSMSFELDKILSQGHRLVLQGRIGGSGVGWIAEWSIVMLAHRCRSLRREDSPWSCKAKMKTISLYYKYWAKYDFIASTISVALSCPNSFSSCQNADCVVGRKHAARMGPAQYVSCSSGCKFLLLFFALHMCLLRFCTYSMLPWGLRPIWRTFQLTFSGH